MQQSVELISDFEHSKPHDECGIVAIVTPADNASELAATAATQLDNRGKESTGLAEFTIEGPLIVTKGFGTGAQIFYEDDPQNEGQRRLKPTNRSHTAQAHTRYSTQGSNTLSAAQPHNIEIANGLERVRMSHIHNGNLTNKKELAARFFTDEEEFHSDSHLMAFVFGEALRDQLDKNPDEPVDVRLAALSVLPYMEGAFTGAISTADQTVIYNDHHGLKPAVIGELQDGGTIVASEVTALDAVNARFVREMNAGEIITIESDGSWTVEQWAKPEPKGCLLELFYFMRPEGVQGTKAIFRGVQVEAARRLAGQVLAETTTPVEDADFVFGIPASGVLAGKGYAEASGTDYSETAVTLRKRDRSFISPTQAQREAAVRAKLKANRKTVKDKVAVAVDDSAIRGTTMRAFAGMYKENDPTALHVRIAFPQVKTTCDLGTDMGDSQEMVANHYEDDPEGMAQYLDVNSIEFISVEDILEGVVGKLIEGGEDMFCTGCMTGNYPSKKPEVVHPHYFPS